MIRDAGANTVVILHHNKPSAYLVPARSYEALMDVIDDLQLLPVVQERIASWQADPGTVTDMGLEELENIAQGAPQKPARAAVKSSRS